MRLWLVRHAQSEANILKVLNTALPGPPLTGLGRQQADALAERLRGERVGAVYASRATRAQQTATPLAASLPTELRVVDGVHEVQVGELEDRGDREALRRYADVVHDWTRGELRTAMPGGESGTEARERFTTAVGELYARHGDADDALVVLVSHGGIIRLGAEWVCGNVPAEVADKELLANTEIVRLESSDGGWRCVQWAGTPLEL